MFFGGSASLQDLCAFWQSAFSVTNNIVCIKMFSHTTVTIGFAQMLNKDTITVCPEILQGVLERALSVFASTSDMTATGQPDVCI